MMNILEAYLHTLDGILTKSESPLEIDAEIVDYFEGHFIKLFESMDTVKTSVGLDSGIYKKLEASKETGDFHAFTCDLADAFFDLSQRSADLRPGVIAFVLFESFETTFFGLLKLNYKSAYFHSVDIISEKITNHLSVKHSSLPGKKQTVDEAFIIDLDTLDLYLKDKQITLDGKHVKYLSDEILSIQPTVSVKKALNIIEKAVKDDSDPIKTAVNKAKMTQYVKEQIESGQSISVQEIATQCFESEHERSQYVSTVRNKGMDLDEIAIHEKQTVKVKANHKIKTESGVEIILPEMYLTHPDNFEIIEEADGTKSILLKRIGAVL